jgi:hypothetical protein
VIVDDVVAVDLETGEVVEDIVVEDAETGEVLAEEVVVEEIVPEAEEAAE